MDQIWLILIACEQKSHAIEVRNHIFVTMSVLPALQQPFHISDQTYRWYAPPSFWDWIEVHGTVEFKNGSKWKGSFALDTKATALCANSLIPHGFVIVTSPSGVIEEHLYWLGR